MRLLLTSIRPTAGRATLLAGTAGRIVDVRRRVGYLPGDLRLYDRLTAREQLESLARLRGGASTGARDELVERFGVPLERPIRELSKGNRQKLGVVQAFMHRPELVVPDEPTSGLDPLLQEEFRALLRETAADGRTAFLSSHSLDEVQHAADRVGIIRSGRLIDVDSVASLRDTCPPPRPDHVRRAGRLERACDTRWCSPAARGRERAQAGRAGHRARRGREGGGEPRACRSRVRSG